MTAGARAFDRSIRAKSESLPVQDGKTVNLFVLLPFLVRFEKKNVSFQDSKVCLTLLKLSDKSKPDKLTETEGVKYFTCCD